MSLYKRALQYKYASQTKTAGIDLSFYAHPHEAKELNSKVFPNKDHYFDYMDKSSKHLLTDRILAYSVMEGLPYDHPLHYPGIDSGAYTGEHTVQAITPHDMRKWANQLKKHIDENHSYYHLEHWPHESEEDAKMLKEQMMRDMDHLVEATKDHNNKSFHIMWS
jgi:hypothetical protein